MIISAFEAQQSQLSVRKRFVYGKVIELNGIRLKIFQNLPKIVKNGNFWAIFELFLHFSKKSWRTVDGGFSIFWGK